ncbi:hypothetical protein NHP214376_02710 [Helicobacter ailurogastricus]|nr:hypothetical protein NHP214376_02710 [Helicobacter ailurogastricus]GLH59418.1 hypothetical protein NHP214377_06850 [Helicobacter ailurogastricus]
MLRAVLEDSDMAFARLLKKLGFGFAAFRNAKMPHRLKIPQQPYNVGVLQKFVVRR